MSEHYPRNTKSVMAYCSTCRMKTMHRVDDRRIGSCLEHGADGMSASQRRRQEKQAIADQQPGLDFTGSEGTE